MPKIQLFTGNATPNLAADIANHLKMPLGKAVVGTFADGETMVELLDNVRGGDVFIIQSTCYPANNNLMELIIMADALRRASATNITAVVPYFGYARQDRRVRSARVPITAKVVADLMASVGINRLLTVDLHADQIQGFFYMPVDNIYGTQVMIDDIKQKGYKDVVIVSPDVGGVVRARAIAKRINDSELAIIDKRRPKANQAEVMHIIGEVENRHCIIVDDMVDTAGTLCQAAKALKAHGATKITAYCTHPIFSDDAVEKIEKSIIDEVVVSDTIPLRENSINSAKIRVLSLSAVIAETIRRVANKESLSLLFPD